MNERALPSARLAALALVVVVAAGLVVLRVAAAPDPVVVPPGARAGDLVLEPCDYATEDATHPADCGTLVVPENRDRPGSRLIALPVIRLRATADRPAEPVFHLEGGPGLSNLDFPQAGRFLDRHDVVLVGYRGVDGSSVLDCPEVASALRRSADFLGAESFLAYGRAFVDCADRLAASGVDLAGYSLAQRADDLEDARVALDYDRINLLSESAGTRTAMIYAWRHPTRLHRSVLVAVNPPGHFGWDGADTDEQLGQYADLCARDPDCRDRTDDLTETLRRTASDLPDRWLFLPIKEGHARLAGFYGLFDSSSAAAIPAPATLDGWLSAAEGDPSGLWFAALAFGLVIPDSFVWGDFAAVGTADAWAFPPDELADDSILGNPGTRFTWGGGRLTGWPTAPGDAEYRQVRRSTVPTLLVGGTLDFSAPPRHATRELLPALPNGQQVVLAGIGHTTDFWASQPAAASRLVNSFLDTGQADDSLFRVERVDFTPTPRHSTLARLVLATLVGLALLTVASPPLLAWRVRRRGRLARWSSVLGRVPYAFLLGLGGWSLGALVVLTLLPTVPITDELVTTVAAGAPVGVGVHLAWVDRARPARVRTVGLAAAGASALTGAWLGYHAGVGLLALLTTVTGAVLAANLALLVLDVIRPARLAR